MGGARRRGGGALAGLRQSMTGYILRRLAGALPTLFIIIALAVALLRFSFNRSQDDIFGRMVTGTSKDEYAYIATGDVTKYGYPSIDSFAKKVEEFSYKRKDNPADCKYILTDDVNSDTVHSIISKFPGLRPVEYSYILGRLQKPVDGVIETCKSAVNICIGLIGIMALFMGFMSIAEKAGGIRFL